ncbi:MAG TPA: hypothetical protein VLF91_04485 [Candidatus Saccharimonadales bacterium]|nr:hypothetical protein [Candidatus Saccharimonadales bacterium]
MNSLRRLLVLTGALVTIIGLAASPLASAEHGSDGSGGSGDKPTASTNERQTTTTNSGSDDTTGAETGDKTSGGTDQSTLHSRAQQLLEDHRKNGTEHSQAQRQQACEKRKDAIDGKLVGLANAGQRHLDNFNRMFDKIQAFQAKNQVNLSNYDALVAAATAKQAAATAAVDALKTSGGTIDCSASDPAANLAIDKTAADDARTALQAYKSALKDLITALMNAKSSAETDNSANTTGGNQ